MNNRIAVFTVTICLSLGASVSADDNVREVQTKLSEQGLYSGEIDGAYSSDLSAALTRYQIRKGLPITGQLDTETSEALGAKPAVTNSAARSDQSSETWRRLRRGEHKTSAKVQATSSPRTEETPQNNSGTSPKESTQGAPAISSGNAKPASAPPGVASDTGARPPEFSAERLRDYVAAFVLAGLDRNIGTEAEFFADRVDYYDSGLMDREKIREDLKRYDEQWPERHFWFAGKIAIEPQNDNRLRVTFPLGFKLRNGNRTLSGKVDKSLVLEAAGDDLQIIAVNERKAESERAER